MEVLREKEAKSKNRMPGLVKAGALAMATTVKPHNPTSDRSPSSNDKGVEKLIEKHQTMAPSVEPPIRPRMNTNISPLLIVPSTFLSILFAIFVFKMWKSGHNENQESGENDNEESGENDNEESGDNENQESGDNDNEEQRDREDQTSPYKSKITDLEREIKNKTKFLRDNCDHFNSFDNDTYFPYFIENLKDFMVRLINTTYGLVEFCKDDDHNVCEAFKRTENIIKSMWGDFNDIRGNLSPVKLEKLLPMKNKTEDYLKKAEAKTRNYLDNLQNLEIFQILTYKSKIDDLKKKIEDKTKRLKTRRWITDDSDSDSDVHPESDDDAFLSKLIEDLNEPMEELIDTTDHLVELCKDDDRNVYEAFKTTENTIQSMWSDFNDKREKLSPKHLKELRHMKNKTNLYLMMARCKTRNYLKENGINAEEQFSMNEDVDVLFRMIDQ